MAKNIMWVAWCVLILSTMGCIKLPPSYDLSDESGAKKVDPQQKLDVGIIMPVSARFILGGWSIIKDGEHKGERSFVRYLDARLGVQNNGCSRKDAVCYTVAESYDNFIFREFSTYSAYLDLLNNVLQEQVRLLNEAVPVVYVADNFSREELATGKEVVFANYYYGAPDWKEEKKSARLMIRGISNAENTAYLNNKDKTVINFEVPKEHEYYLRVRFNVAEAGSTYGVKFGSGLLLQVFSLGFIPWDYSVLKFYNYLDVLDNRGNTVKTYENIVSNNYLVWAPFTFGLPAVFTIADEQDRLLLSRQNADTVVRDLFKSFLTDINTGKIFLKNGSHAQTDHHMMVTN